MDYSLIISAVFLLAYALGCSIITRRDQQSTAAELAARLRADPNWTARETARLRNAPQPDAVASFVVDARVDHEWEPRSPEYRMLTMSGERLEPGDVIVVHKILRKGETT